MDDGGCGEEGINDGARAVGGEFSPVAGDGGVDAEDVVGEAEFQAVDPCGELAGRGRVGAVLDGDALPEFAEAEDADVEGGVFDGREE